MAEDKEKTLQFIEDYRSFNVLWDQNHKDYTNKTKRVDALTALGEKYGFDIKTVKNKVKSLRSYFSREHHKVLTKKSGSNYRSPWFAYNALLFILDSKTATQTENEEKSTSENLPDLETEEESSDSQTTTVPEDYHEFLQPIRKKRTISKSSQDEKEELCKITKTTAENVENKDGCTIFGELIANKLRSLSRRNRIIAEHRISDIFFDLELKEIDTEPLNQVESAVLSVVPQKLSPEASTSAQSAYSPPEEFLPRNDNIEYTPISIQPLATEHQQIE